MYYKHCTTSNVYTLNSVRIYYGNKNMISFDLYQNVGQHAIPLPEYIGQYYSNLYVSKTVPENRLHCYARPNSSSSREGRGAMARARSFANVTACRAVSNPAWCRIFREISCFSPLNIGALFQCCVLGQGTLPLHAPLDSGVRE